jgi:hypothetical protein
MPLKTCFAKVERELAKIVVTFNKDVEGAELHLLVTGRWSANSAPLS